MTESVKSRRNRNQTYLKPQLKVESFFSSGRREHDENSLTLWSAPFMFTSDMQQQQQQQQQQHLQLQQLQTHHCKNLVLHPTKNFFAKTGFLLLQKLHLRREKKMSKNIFQMLDLV